MQEAAGPQDLELRPDRGTGVQALFLAGVVVVPLAYVLLTEGRGRSPLDFFRALAPGARHGLVFQLGSYFLAALATIAFSRSRRLRLTSSELVYSSCVTRKACPLSALAKATYADGGARSGGPFLEFWSSDGTMAARVPLRVFSSARLLTFVQAIRARNPSFQVEPAAANYLSGL
jgi:hypothetical protein